MGFDHATGTYVPRTAASLTSNADQTDWVLKLKPSIKFTDGTPYDAVAVKFNLDRLMKTPNALPAPILLAFIDSITVVDPLTVDIKLKKAWSGIPYELSHQPGMMASPAVIQRLGTDFNVKGLDAGAGPFMVDSYVPQDALVLKRNPTYYGGTVYLDQIRFIPTNGAAGTELAIKNGGIQGGLLMAPDVVGQAKTDGLGVDNVLSLAGSVAELNVGLVPCRNGAPVNVCAGKPDGTVAQLNVPTKDITVRRAIAAAIDPKVVNDRVYAGKADASSALLPGGLRWNVDVPGSSYNVNQAKQLVAQAKANGWDGKIRVSGNSTPEGVAWTEAVTAMLQTAGMTVTPDTSKTGGAAIAQVLIQRNFDVAIGGIGLPADQTDRIYEALYLQDTTATYRYGYGGPDMDAAVDGLRTATNDQQRTTALKNIATVWARDVPFVNIAHTPEAFVHSAKLHGSVMSSNWIELFDKAWIAP
jgi:peptide/nickel transport system substrate-binding protein